MKNYRLYRRRKICGHVKMTRDMINLVLQPKDSSEKIRSYFEVRLIVKFDVNPIE
jgi:hypothetical protein